MRSADTGRKAASGRRITEIWVVVPARDEEELIGRCLTALLGAEAHLHATHPAIVVRIVVVADFCTDGTVDRVRERHGDRIELINVDAGRVGIARAAGFRLLSDGRTRRRLRGVWLANTDADSVVPPNWLTHQWEQASAGADVVVGTVRPDPLDLTAEQEAKWRETHLPGRPNGHVHGANLGMRATSYRRAGGFDPVAEHEDNLLVDRLRRAPAVIVASDQAEVLTSGRRAGRTPGGYAAYLEQSLGSPEEAAHRQAEVAP